MRNYTIMSIILLVLLSVSNIAIARTKQVTLCKSYLVGATYEMDCSGDFNGKASFVSLYRSGWSYAGDISGTSGFMLVFEK